MKIPRLSNDYANVYRPSGNVYPGLDGKELRHGQWYEQWVPNDHTFVVGPDGGWHIFGITHPLTSAANIHEGEEQLFHAQAPADCGFTVGSFVDKGSVLPPGERPGEVKEIHSPFIVRKDGLYHMIYGPTTFRMASSADLRSWTLGGELFHDLDGASRDPQVMCHDGKYFLCYCSGNEVRLRESADLLVWDGPWTILTLPEGVSPESPFLLCHENVFYLFVCTWDGVWDHKAVSGAYQHKTLVFVADTPRGFVGKRPVAEVDAHAPEIFQRGAQYYISSAEWPERGINVAPLDFV